MGDKPVYWLKYKHVFGCLEAGQSQGRRAISGDASIET